MDQASISTTGTGLRRSRANQSGTPHLRVVPWQGDRHVALVGPSRNGQHPTVIDLLQCVRKLDECGVGRAVTPALDRYDSQPFLDAGFHLLENLHLLSRPLLDEPPPVSRKLAIGRPWHRAAVLKIDARAFDPFWQFDETSLREARSATPASRFRVATDGRNPIGYAVTGRAGSRGYLQRLAVDPDRHGQGIGSDLVNDALHWLYRHGATMVMVNTQERNQRALSLYEHLGFKPDPTGLVVLERRRPT